MKKISSPGFSGLVALAVLTGFQARADNFTTITVTGATAATVVPRWTIGSNQSGLGYIGGDSGLPNATATNFFTITGANVGALGAPLGFTSYAPVTVAGNPTVQGSVGNALTPNSYDGLTYVATDLGLTPPGPLNFYAIHHRATGDYLAQIRPANSTVVDQKPMSSPGTLLTPGGTGYFALSFAAENAGSWGPNLFYYLRNDAVTGHTMFGSLIPALLSGPTDRWDLGLASAKGYTDLAYTTTDPGFGLGINKFYYLRLDPITHTSFFGWIDPLTGAATDIQNLGRAYRTLVFTPTAISNYGTNNFYSISVPGPQTITFAAIPAHTACDAAFTLAPTASSGLAVTLAVTSGPAIIVGNTVTLTGAGTVVLTATQPGDSNFLPAPSVVQSFVVAACALLPQTITFPAVPAHTACDVAFTLAPTASSGLPVTLVASSGPATVVGSTVTLTGTGTVVLTASQAGNGTYSAATSVAQSFVVTACVVPPIPQTITFASIPPHTACDGAFTLAPIASSGLPVTLVVTSGPATVSGNTVTLTGATGTVVLTSSQAGNGTYAAAANVVQSFAVTACALTPQTISFAPVPSHGMCEDVFSLNPTASSGLPVTLTVTSGPATVSGKIVTLTGPGTVVLTATQAGNGTYAGATSVSQTFVVTPIPVITNNPLTAAATVGTPFSYTLTASGSPTRYTAFNLPAGLFLNPVTGVISGTPTASDLPTSFGPPATATAGADSPRQTARTIGPTFVTVTAINGNCFSTPVYLIIVTAAAGAPPVITSPFDVQRGGLPVSPNIQAGTIGSPFAYQITATGSPTSFGAVNLPPGLAVNATTGAITGTPTVADRWFVTVQAKNAAGTGDALVIFDIAPAPAAPVITSASSAPGTAGTPFVTYAITASGQPTSYAATGLPAGLTLNPLTGAITGTPTTAGAYTVTLSATNAIGTTTSVLTISIAPGPSSRIVNFSARALSGPGSDALVMGFVVSGNGKHLLVRGVGPTLSSLGLANVLADPFLTVSGPAGTMATNDDWQTTLSGQPDGALLAPTATRVGAFALANGSKDSALLLTFNTGAYAASLLSPNSPTGVALAEIFDTDTVLGPRLVNVSARVNVSLGEGTLIAGFVIGGTVPKTVLIRGIGPTLSVFGVTGALADPQIAVYAGSTQIATNDNWEVGTSTGAQIATASAKVGAFALPAGSKDAALLITLQPGAYTVLVTGVANTTGVALVEVYDTQ